MYRLEDMTADATTTNKDYLDQLFAGLPAQALGNRFLIISRLALVEHILSAVSARALFHLDSEWVYMVTDSARGGANMAPYLATAQDGYNLAFIYNTSLSGEGAGGRSCHGGLVCLLEQAVEQLARSMEQVLEVELKTFDEVSIEEWEIIMPSLQVQSIVIYYFVFCIDQQSVRRFFMPSNCLWTKT
jgi:hypothetical protein